MRITYVLPHGWRFAGWSIEDLLSRYHFSKHLASAMARLDHEVILLLLHEDLQKATILQESPFRIEAFPVTMTIPFLRFGGDLSRPLIRRIERTEADVVHIHGSFYEALRGLVRAAKAPVVVQWHGGRATPLHRFLFRAAYRDVRRILIPFPAARDLFRGILDTPSRFEVVPLPLRPEAEAALPKTEYGFEHPRFLYVGRIAQPGGNLWERRLDLVLRMLSRLKATRFTLDVVGEGPGRTACERIANEEGIGGSVFFHGYLSLDELLPLYRDAVLTLVPFVLPDLTGTWVAQVQESLAVGTPVVAFSPDRTLKDDGVGWRISPDPELGASHLMRVLSRPETIETKGRVAPFQVRAQCREQAVSALLLSVYRGLER